MNETQTGVAVAPDVYRAISAVQAEIATIGVAKTRRNPQQGYQFRGIDDIYDAIAGIMPRHGLVVIPCYMSRSVDERQTKQGGTLFYVTIEGVYRLVSVRDGSSVEARTYGEAMDSGDKATNKAMSAAFKYLCLQLFTIPLQGEDAEEESPAPGPSTKPKNKPSTNNPNPTENASTPQKWLDEEEERHQSTMLEAVRNALSDASASEMPEIKKLIVSSLSGTAKAEAVELYNARSRALKEKTQ